MEPVATTAAGISTGTVLIVGGIVLVLGTIIYLNKTKTSKQPVDDILTKEGRYEEYKSLIEDAIINKDYEYLEKKLTSKMTDFPDLIQMIKKALKNR